MEQETPVSMAQVHKGTRAIIEGLLCILRGSQGPQDAVAMGETILKLLKDISAVAEGINQGVELSAIKTQMLPPEVAVSVVEAALNSSEEVLLKAIDVSLAAFCAGKDVKDLLLQNMGKVGDA